MRPPASPDLNPLDINIWSILEAEACAKTHNTSEGLRVSLKETGLQTRTRRTQQFWPNSNSKKKFSELELELKLEKKFVMFEFI